MHIASIGIDVGKTTFHSVALGPSPGPCCPANAQSASAAMVAASLGHLHSISIGQPERVVRGDFFEAETRR